jgi:enoyl-CoA hydratase
MRMAYETLRYEQADHVVTLTYDRPEQHNAVNQLMNSELHDAWRRFRDDDDAFVLVITGAGETTFCAGWDLQDAAELSELGDYDAFRVSLHNSPGACGYTRKVDIFKPVIAAVNGYAFAAGLETALLADIRIAAENAEFGALERRWNIVGGDGMTVRLPLVVGFAKAMELIITGRRVDVHEAHRIGLVNEVVPLGQALTRAQELAHQIAALPQGAIRSDKESVMRGVGRTLEERLRIEAEQILSMFMRRDSHTLGAAAFKAGNLTPHWPHHGLCQSPMGPVASEAAQRALASAPTRRRPRTEHCDGQDDHGDGKPGSPEPAVSSDFSSVPAGPKSRSLSLTALSARRSGTLRREPVWDLSSARSVSAIDSAADAVGGGGAGRRRGDGRCDRSEVVGARWGCGSAQGSSTLAAWRSR